MRRRAAKAGFTLTELMVVVAIVGILATLAIWNMTTVLPHWRLRTTTSDVRGALAFARARAIAQNRTYVVHFAADRYRIYWDKTGDGVTADDELVREETYERGVTYVRPSTDPLPASDTVVYAPSGLATNITVAGQFIGLVNAAGSRQIEVFYTGLTKQR